jgi:hypothetical protein
MKEYVPEVHVIGDRIFATAKDKAFLDRELAERGLPPIRVEVVEPGGPDCVSRPARPRLHS